jgi:hypothetical protein
MNLGDRFMRTLVNLGICVALLAAPAVVHADTIFSNFGPGSSYNTAIGNPVGDGLDGTGFNYAEGNRFTVGTTSSLSSIMIALSCAVCPAGGSLTVSLTQNASNQPGAVVESFSILGSTLGLLGNNNPPLTLTSLLQPPLSAGSQYWVTVSGLPTSAVAWNWNNTGDGSPTALSVDGGASWFAPAGLTPGAYAVNGIVAPIPEPGAVWLLSTGIFGLGGIEFQRRRKRKSRVLPSKPTEA